jgi:hypothetical protein
LFFIGCSSNTPYYKITLTDELNPAGFFAEPIEVNNLGKVIYKTHIHNENDNLYQNLFFGELSNSQMDSVGLLMSRIEEYPINFEIDSTKPAYKISITTVVDENKHQRIIAGNQFNQSTIDFVNYIKSLPDACKRYDLKGNYFFETDNICIGSFY